MLDGARVAAAIDLGTHGSGYAWCVIDEQNDNPSSRRINLRDSWQGETIAYPKNLTAVAVNAAGEVVEWGFQARNDWRDPRRRSSLSGYAYAFKMALGPGERTGVARAEGSIDLADPDQLRSVFVGYLRKICGVAAEEIREAGFLDEDVRWCITVPAIWSQADRAFTRDVAVAAGLPSDDSRLLIVTEPEAAAVYCQGKLPALLDREHSGAAPPMTLDGARFMVVDCGGGTIDISSYRSEVRSGGIRLEEIGRVTGGKLGSEYVNNAFVASVLAPSLGEEVFASLREQRPKDIDRMVSQWEGAKSRLAINIPAGGLVRVVREVEIDIRAPVWDRLEETTRKELTEAANGDSQILLVPPERSQELLDSVVEPALEKISEQFAEMRENSGAVGGEMLLLVGGFARSDYLRERVKHRFSECRVVLPEDPAAAVLFGAVNFCYDPSVLWARRAARTYVMDTYLPFADGVDPVTERVVGEGGKAFCRRRATVVARAGQQVEVDEPLHWDLQPIDRESTVLEIDLYATDQMDPRYVEDVGFDPVAAIEVDISASVGKPVSERVVEVCVYFGRALIEVEAFVKGSTEKIRTSATFESSY